MIYKGVNGVPVGAAMEILEGRLGWERVVRRKKLDERNASDAHFQLVLSVSSA